MANLLTRGELIEKIREMQKAADSMTADNQRVCEKCLMLYEVKRNQRDLCYCDYESDRDYD